LTSQTQKHFRREERYRTDDVDLLSGRYYAAPIDFVQVDSGRLGAEIHAVATPKVEVREAHFDSTVLNLVQRPLGRYGIALGTTGNAQLFGTRFNNSNLAYTDGRNGVIARIDAGSGWCNLTIDNVFLQDVAAVHDYIIPAGDDARGLPIFERAALLERLARIARSQEGATLSDEQFEDAMALLVLRTLNPVSRYAAKKPDKCWTVAHEVIDFIHANYTRPMTLTALCQLVGVSERTLRYNFLKATGLSLQRYLTHYRLHRARALLVESKVADVRDAAAACGIPHAGRFSQYYKALFGESPGEVLKRSAHVYRGRHDL
jgi:AraC-like DNA-binding protein